jgi:hypothetical protein
MTDVETKLRDGLAAFAAETEAIASPPSMASIALRGGMSRPKRPRWPKVAVAIVAATLVTTGVAAATGNLPGAVESKLREFGSFGYNARGDASRLAWTSDGDMTYELWRAPIEGGRLCIFERVIGPDGDIDLGGGYHCASDQMPWGIYPQDTGGPVWTPAGDLNEVRASGRLPEGAIEAVFEFEDGTTHTVLAQNDRYFITAFRGVAEYKKIVAVQARDANGTVVADLWHPSP